MCHINIGMPLRHNDIEDISHLLTHLSTAAQMILTGSAIPDRDECQRVFMGLIQVQAVLISLTVVRMEEMIEEDA
jgi:hypothetical protein